MISTVRVSIKDVIEKAIEGLPFVCFNIFIIGYCSKKGNEELVVLYLKVLIFKISLISWDIICCMHRYLLRRLNFSYTKVFDVHVIYVIPSEYCYWTSPCYHLIVRATAVRIATAPVAIICVSEYSVPMVV